MASATVYLSPVVTGDRTRPSDQVKCRMLYLTLNSVALPPVTLDPATDSYSLLCNAGDTLAANAYDTNAFGSSEPGMAVATNGEPPPTRVPETPTVAIAFTP